MASLLSFWPRRRARGRRSLGDKLQILAAISPRVLTLIESIVDEVLRNEGLWLV